MTLSTRSLSILASASLVVFATLAIHAQGNPPAGKAVGTLSVNGKTYTLAHAAAFVDQKDSRKPTVLLLTDQPVPDDVLTGKTTISFSQNMSGKPFSGVTLWLDKDRTIFRAEYHEKDSVTATSGLFVL